MAQENNITPKTVLRDYLRSKPDKVYTRISPSNLGKCHRAHYYKLKGEKETVRPTDSALANFEVGFLWEQLIKTALDQQKVPYTFQDHFDDIEINMAGSSDFIVEQPDGKKVMWDSKTMASKWFWYRESQKKKGLYDWWDDNYYYIIQQGAYLLMAERLGYKIEKSILAFISKDDGFIGEELEVHLTAKLRKEVMGRVEKMNHYLSRDILPPCTCDGFLVSYCSYANPNTMEYNRTKKLVATQCCGEPDELELWRNKP